MPPSVGVWGGIKNEEHIVHVQSVSYIQSFKGEGSRVKQFFKLQENVIDGRTDNICIPIPFRYAMG